MYDNLVVSISVSDGIHRIIYTQSRLEMNNDLEILK